MVDAFPPQTFDLLTTQKSHIWPPKKKHFLSKFSKKCLQTPFWLVFFFNFDCGSENLVIIVFIVIWESLENPFA